MNQPEANRNAEYMKKHASDLIEESVDASPGRIAEICVELTSVKAYFSELLDKILVFKATRLEDLRVDLGSSSAARSKWNSLDEGRNEIILRGIIGRIKDQVSVLKQRITVAKDQSWGSY